MISGIQVDKNGAIYVTVPRWKNDVPATLNMLNQVNYTLQPYLSYSMQREGVSGDLQNAKSIFIDSKSRMWIMEIGRRNYLMPNTNDHVSGNAGVWIIDMDPINEDIVHGVDGSSNENDSSSSTNKTNIDCCPYAPIGNVTSKFYFPDSIVSTSTGLLASMVVDDSNDVAYLSDAGNGGIVIYYLRNATSKRVEDTLYNTMAKDAAYSIGGVMGHFKTDFEVTSSIPFPALSVTGIAVDDFFLYYSALQGNKLYRIPIAKLTDSSLSISDFSDSIECIGEKSASDAMMIKDYVMYYSSLSESTYYSIPLAGLINRDNLDTTALNSSLLVGNYSEIDCFGGQCYNTTSLENLNRFVNRNFTTKFRNSAIASVWNMRWINSFASDYKDSGKIWMISNHLDMFVEGNVDSSFPSMAIIYDYPSFPSTPEHICTLEELFEDWMEPPHTVIAIMAIGACTIIGLELLIAGSCYVWVKRQLKWLVEQCNNDLLISSFS